MIVTEASGAAIALSDNDGIHCRARAGGTAPALDVQLDCNEPGLWDECFRRNKVLFCHDVDADSHMNRTACKELGIRSALAAPIGCDDTVAGVLQVCSERVFAFGEADAQLLTKLARIAYTPAQAGSRLAIVQQYRSVSLRREQGKNEMQEVVALQHLSNRSLFFRRKKLATVFGAMLLTLLISLPFWRISRNFSGSSQERVTPVHVVSNRTGHAGEPPAADSVHQAEVQVTKIDWFSDKSQTRILIRLDGAARFESHRLRHPMRIFVDLYPVRLGPDLYSKSEKVFQVHDRFAHRIRVAQKELQTSRVVVDLKIAPEYARAWLLSPSCLVIAIAPRENIRPAARAIP
jgi:hypothetical protein